jgi:hypothetical protein
MRKAHISVLSGALLAASLTGCTDFLTGEGVTNDPNFPTAASRDQLFVGYQATQFVQQEGNVALLGCFFMQQCSGLSNFMQFWDKYDLSAEETDASFVAIYTGGGLVDLRRVQAIVEADGDDQYLGVTKVWEALGISFGADNWGDIPYSEAATEGIPEPVFDDQMAIYAALQTVLDEAITDLGGTGPGPGAVDLIYGGNAAKWIKAANTMKARLHMHTAERLGNTAYTAAIAAASNGILLPADDFRTYHSTATAERNLWHQLHGSGFPYAVAGRRLVDLMKQRNDSRIPDYFADAVENDPDITYYGGKDVNGATPADSISSLGGSGRDVPQFRQPILTADETELILAEAKFQVNGGGAAGAAAAAPHLNTVRQRYGQLPILVPTLNDIMTEKYIALFQNIEVWQDYKRTCLPTLTPVTRAGFPFEVPGRILYGSTEGNANPNTPTTSEQLDEGGIAHGRPGVGGFRNANDPTPCTS